MDFVKAIKPDMTSKQLVRTGQIATLVLVLLAALWAPQIDRFGSLFDYLQIILGLIAPPIVAVFLMGLFWKRANGHGAIAGLAGGFILAIFIILSSIFEWVPAINEIHFLHKAPLLMLAVMVIQMLVSLMTAPPEEEKVDGMVWSSKIFRAEAKELEGLPWYKNYRILSILLLIVTAAIVVWFW
tara:strand:+ start:97 stop:648 length:552 start_codon:yes stop_codon:yes gene_type:complete